MTTPEPDWAYKQACAVDRALRHATSIAERDAIAAMFRAAVESRDARIKALEEGLARLLAAPSWHDVSDEDKDAEDIEAESYARSLLTAQGGE